MYVVCCVTDVKSMNVVLTVSGWLSNKKKDNCAECWKLLAQQYDYQEMYTLKVGYAALLIYDAFSIIIARSIINILFVIIIIIIITIIISFFIEL